MYARYETASRWVTRPRQRLDPEGYCLLFAQFGKQSFVVLTVPVIDNEVMIFHTAKLLTWRYRHYIPAVSFQAILQLNSKS